MTAIHVQKTETDRTESHSAEVEMPEAGSSYVLFSVVKRSTPAKSQAQLPELLVNVNLEAGATTAQSRPHARFVLHTPSVKAGTNEEHFEISPLQLKVIKVSDALGGASKLSEILGVNRSQATRWLKGEASPQPITHRLIDDLDYVIDRAQQLWEPDVATQWLLSPNAFLDGATPLAMLQTRGLSEVADALDATEAGAYA